MSGRNNFVRKLYRHQKRWYAKWHTAAGVLAGSVLLIVSLTGAILVFEQEIDHWLNPELFEFGSPKNNRELSYDQILERFESQIGEKEKIRFLFSDEHLGGAFVGYLQDDDRQFILNPYTGDIAGKRIYKWESFTGFVKHLHRTLLIPSVGRYLVGVSSLMCVVLMISGLRLWIPKKLKNLKSRLTIKTDASAKRVNYDSHNTLGFYFSPVISILSMTGAAITFNQFIILGLFLVGFAAPKSLENILSPQSAYRPDTPTLSLSDIEREVKKHKPDGLVQGYELPKDSLGVISVSVMEPVDYHQVGHVSRMSFDQYSGALIFSSDRDVPPTSRVYIDWVTPLHYGTFGGNVTRIIALVSCLVCAGLFITGFYIWIPRWKKAKNKTKKNPEQVLA
ncbi:membrane protein [Fulvitalea axinellae]|uniref:Membrane protein n=1 Tax=Fulvitalea axinellae TaxID=1182444 RepID=A0AAU9CB50_9BACT|nr:membrane protein [Fulvitalea axinellae]